MTSTDLVPADVGAVALPGTIHASLAGLTIDTAATNDEILAALSAFETFRQIDAWAVGDLANVIRERFTAADYENWLESYPAVSKHTGTELDQKTIKKNAGVCRFYPLDFRSRYVLKYEGRRALSFSHFSEVKKYGMETAEYWLERCANEDLSLVQLQALLTEGLPGADEAPPLPTTSALQFGQAYWLGPAEDPQRHLLVCGDAKDPAHHAYASLLGRPIDCVWTDPPYGVDYVSIGRALSAAQAVREGATEEAAAAAANIMTIDNDGEGDIAELLQAAWANLAPYLIDGAPFYVAGPSGANMETFLRSFREASWAYKQMLIWRKNQMVFGRSDYHLQHEPVFHGYTANPSGAPRGRVQGLQGRQGLWYGDDSQTSVLDVDRPRVSEDHPTMKPTRLIQAHLLNSTKEGDVVADPFAGSGSTLIAAEMTGRRAFVIEYDPNYAQVIYDRYHRFLEEQAASGMTTERAVRTDPVQDDGNILQG